MDKTRVENRMSEIRNGRGLKAAELAKRVNINRATVYAIEAGTYVPNTQLALQLARELEVTVDELFSLAGASPRAPESLTTEVLSASAAPKGQPMRICQVGARWVAVPASATPYFMPQADAILQASRTRGRADLIVLADGGTPEKRLTLAGCDPATSLLSAMVEKASAVEVVAAAASSRLALQWLKEGKVHIAGSHLEDPKTGEFNLPFIRKEFSGEQIVAVTFARWEEGFVVATGNPKRVKTVQDLARRGVRFVNRELGSGSRALLDKLLEKGGIPPASIAGYDRVAFGHLAAAYGVLSGDVDACLATRSAAQTFGLDFVPLRSARYDLVMRKHTVELPSVQAFLDVLQRATLRRKLEVLAGYDTRETGTLLAA